MGRVSQIDDDTSFIVDLGISIVWSRGAISTSAISRCVVSLVAALIGVTMLGIPAGVAPALTLSVGFDGDTLVAEEVTPFPVIYVGDFESTGTFIIIGARFSSKLCLLLWPTECDEEVEASAADDGKEGTIKPPDEGLEGWSCGLRECSCENMEKEEGDNPANEGSSVRDRGGGTGGGVAEGGLCGKLALTSILRRFIVGSRATLESVFEVVGLRWSGE